MSYDNSQLQTFKDCPEKYRLRYLEGLKKREEGVDEHDKEFGKAIHAGLEAYYKKASMVEVKKAFSDNYPLQLNGEDLAKTQANGLLLLDGYAKHYAEQDKQWTVKAVEVADEFELAPGILFTVKIDLVVEQQGCIYFVDHKTTGKTFNWAYWGQFEPNSQLSAYTAYCQAKYGECSGGIINAIQLGYRQRAYKGEPAGFHYGFQRQLFNRNQSQIKAWKEDTKGWINRLEATKEDEGGPWLKNEGQCRFCSYKEICISVNDEQVKEQLYEKVNPKEYLNDNGRGN